MKKPLAGLCLALTIACALPAAAQQRPLAPPSGPSAQAVRNPVRAPVVTTRPTVQTGLSGNPSGPSSPSAPNCDSGGSSGYQPSGGYYNSYGYPQYPGPNAPLPAPGSYYANPYDYYDNYNPYNPYGYSQNTGYYNTGYYSSGSSGYYSSGGYSPNYSTGDSYPAFQGYDTGSRR